MNTDAVVPLPGKLLLPTTELFNTLWRRLDERQHQKQLFVKHLNFVLKEIATQLSACTDPSECEWYLDELLDLLEAYEGAERRYVARALLDLCDGLLSEVVRFQIPMNYLRYHYSEIFFFGRDLIFLHEPSL